MPQFVESSIRSPAAAQLLEEYFAYRASTFPTPGGYRVASPDPTLFTRPRGVFLVVTDDEVESGCGGIRMLSPTRAEIKHLWVRPGSRGRGLGRAILAELERLAAELGASETVLDTNASLDAAGGLYRASGYSSIEPYNDNPNATNWYRKPLA